MKAELGLLHPDTSGVILKEVERSVVVVEMKNRVKNILVEYSKFYNAVKTLWSYVPASLPVVDVKKAWDAIEVIEVHFDRLMDAASSRRLRWRMISTTWHQRERELRHIWTRWSAGSPRRSSETRG